jgi:hypothetical protein
MDSPQVLAYPEGAPGTYPGWYDPGYWSEGLTPRFDLRRQLVSLKTNAEILFDILFARHLVALIAAAAVLCVARGIAAARRLRESWFLLLPALAAVTAFWSIWVEPRYIGPFLGLLFAGIFAAAALGPSLEHHQRLATTVTVCAGLTFVIAAGATAVQADLIGTQEPTDWRVAKQLQRVGAGPGSAVGAIGRTMHCGWARLARVHIKAEIPHEAAGGFYAADEATKTQAVNALFRAGIQAVVADFPETAGCAQGWVRVPYTEFSICPATGGSR